MTKSKKTAVNPVVYSDFPDPDVIRVENTYYMVSTTMHFMPGAVILRSYNLADWEIAGHVYDKLDDYESARMEQGKNIYGSGMWAASLKFHNGKFYLLHIANDTHCSYLYTADKAEGPWVQKKIPGFYYDPGLFFDDDGRVFVAHGNREIHITELNEDFSGPKEGGIDTLVVRDIDENPLGWEGSHLYKINGKYILCVIHWGKKDGRAQGCFTADRIEGPWTGGTVLSDTMESSVYTGVAQGGLIDTPDGDWYAMLFQDHGAEGRMPCLVPVSWKDGIPVFGVDGKVPESLEVTDYNAGYKYAPLFESDDFSYELKNGNHPKLKNVWEWNHIPDEENWWIEKEKNAGVLCIRTSLAKQNVVSVRNTLTQRLVGPAPKVSVTLDGSKLNDGDVMGLAAFMSCYGFEGITKKDGKFYAVRCVKTYADGKITPNRNDREPCVFSHMEELKGSQCEVMLDFDFTPGKDEVNFFWREPGSKDWKMMGGPHKLPYLLDHFTGARAGLFVYSTEESGGMGKFRHFKSN